MVYNQRTHTLWYRTARSRVMLSPGGMGHIGDANFFPSKTRYSPRRGGISLSRRRRTPSMVRGMLISAVFPDMSIGVD